MMGEILPGKIRGSAASVATAFNWACTFVVTKTFMDIIGEFKSLSYSNYLLKLSFHSCDRKWRSFLVLRMCLYCRSLLRHLLRAGDARKVAGRHREKDDGPSQKNVVCGESQTDELQLVTLCAFQQPIDRHRFSKKLKVKEVIVGVGRNVFGRQLNFEQR